MAEALAGAPGRAAPVLIRIRASRDCNASSRGPSAALSSSGSSPESAASDGSPAKGRPGKSLGLPGFSKRGSVEGAKSVAFRVRPSRSRTDRTTSSPTKYSKSSSCLKVSPVLVPSVLGTRRTSFSPRPAKAAARRAMYSEAGNTGLVQSENRSAVRSDLPSVARARGSRVRARVGTRRAAASVIAVPAGVGGTG
jgi:hypothetical protein